MRTIKRKRLTVIRDSIEKRHFHIQRFRKGVGERGLSTKKPWHFKDFLAPTPSVRQPLFETSDTCSLSSTVSLLSATSAQRLKGRNGIIFTMSYMQDLRLCNLLSKPGAINKPLLDASVLWGARGSHSIGKISLPPPPHPILARRYASARVGGVYFEAPPQQEFRTPPLAYTPHP